MNRSLQIIQQKVGSMRHGLLKFPEEGEKPRLHVSTTLDNANKLNCVIKESPDGERLLNKEVVLIQKNNKDYLYISGRIDDEVNTTSKVISLTINKACWFVRKAKGNMSWLRQKYIYENPERKIDIAS
jgi:hypothetical protein